MVVKFSDDLIKLLVPCCFSAEHAHPADIMSYLEHDPVIKYVFALGGSGHGPYLILLRYSYCSIEDGTHGLKRLDEDVACAHLQEFPIRHPEQALKIIEHLYLMARAA